MRAAVWHQEGDIRIEDIPAPGEPGPGEAIVEVAYCGICGTDLHEYQDGPHFIPKDAQGKGLVSILGHEFSGTVLRVGEGVTRVKPGDRVAVHPALYCGECRYCTGGVPQLCPRASWVGLGARWGGLAEQVLAQEYELFPLPESISLLQGALVEPCSVVHQAISRGGVQPGDRVLITGGGPIGQLAAMVARAVGAAEVYLSEVVPFRREQAARTAEPTRVFDPSAESVPQALLAATDGQGVDVTLEASASERALHDAIDSTRTDGTIVQIAIFGRPVTLHPALDITLRARRYVGSLGYAPADYRRVIQLMSEGRLPAERIVTARLGLEDTVDRGIRELGRADTTHTKILVAPNGER